jgi:hypothetical protein
MFIDFHRHAQCNMEDSVGARHSSRPPKKFRPAPIQRVKVKESRNRPGVVQKVPGGLGSQISWHSSRKGGEVVSLTHRLPLPPRMFLVLIFTRGWVDRRAMERSEGNILLKNPVTPPGIDPRTVRVVQQCRNHYATQAPYSTGTGVYFLWSGVDHSPPTSAEMKNEWIYTSAPPIWLHGVLKKKFSTRI